jgi:relaxase/mobilisation nuclease domain
VLANGIVKEDLYTAYYAVSEKEEIVADREIEIPGMDEDMLVERTEKAVVEPGANVEVMNPNNNQNEIGRQKEQADSARKQQTDLEGIEFRKSIIYLIRMWQELVKVLLM